jgi:hypothetical protein
MQNRRFNWLFSLVLIGLSIILVRYSLTWHFLQVADKRLADEGVDGSRKPLTKLTDAQAEALSKYKGSLDLRDLEQVTDFQAVILSQHQGPLYLDGLHHLTDVQAEWFGKCKYYLSLNGLKSLTTVQARHLSRHGGVSLRGERSAKYILWSVVGSTVLFPFTQELNHGSFQRFEQSRVLARGS